MGAQSSILTLRFRKQGATGLRIDDIILSGTSGAPVATITTGTLTPAGSFTTTQGTASVAKSYTLTGSNLTAALNVGPFAGYEFSTDGFATAPVASLSLTPDATGAVSATVSVRLTAATTVAGSPYSGNIANASTGATTQNVAVTGTVSAAATVPTGVSTTAATAITSTMATTGGNITTNGGTAITARGVLYSTTANPRLGGAGVTNVPDAANAVGSFTSNLTGLTASTTYYVAAYATNSVGTTYATDQSFTTLAPATAPSVATTAASAITASTATSGGNVMASGGATITARGVVYSTTPTPQIGGTGVTQVANASPGTGTFTSSLTGLSGGTTYYVAAYATNSAGTGYGTDVTFTTTAPTLTATPGSLSGFSNYSGTASAEQTYVLAGNGLSAPITVAAPSGVEVSLTTGTSFGSTVSVPAAGGTVYVRIAAATPVGPISAIITNVSGAASQDVTVSGTVLSPPLLGYTFPATSSASPTTQAANVTGSVFSRATSLTSTQDTPDFRSTGFPISTASPAANSVTGYYQFTFTAAAGNTANLTTLIVSDRSSGTGPTKWEVRTSLDGYTATVGAVQTNPTTTLTPRTVNLTGTAALSTVTGAVTFHIYAYGGSSSGSGTFAVDDVNLFGSLTAGTPPAAEPTVQPTVTASGATTTTVLLSLSGGDGTKRLVVVRPNAAAAAAPVDGTMYTANTTYGTTTGTNPATGTSNFVVIADGSTTSLTVTGLASGTAYNVEAYAYNDNATAGLENYLATSPGTATFTTLTPPAITYTWNGTGTSYSAATSWTPPRAVTAASDILLFDGTVTTTANVTLDFTTPETIAALKLQGGVIATLSTDANRTLNLSGVATPANLVVGTADSLRLYNTVANMGLTIQLATGATASIDGGIAADGSAFSSGTTHKILGTSATPNAIVFHTGSAITATANFGGNVFGSAIGFAGTVLFEAGSSYFQQGGASPFGAAGTSASVTFQSGSYYRFVPAILTAPSFSGRTYGTFVYNPGFTTAPTTSGGNPLVIRNDLRVLTGSLPINLTGSISIKGDIKVDGNAILSFLPASTPTAPLQLNGTTVQTIGGTNTSTTGLALGSNVTLQINNAQGVLLQRPLTVPGTLQLTSGNITTAAINLLTLSSNATGGSATSFVNGPLARVTDVGAATTVFPVGKGTFYRPITLISTAQALASTYTAEQFEGNPTRTLAPGNGLGTAPLARVSSKRFYTVTSSNTDPGNFSGTVTLSFGAEDYVNVPSSTDFVIAKRDATGSFANQWTNLGRSGNTGTDSGAGGPSVAGTLTSASFSDFSDFVLGAQNDLSNTNVLSAINPLPVELTAFSAQRQADKTVSVKWATATEKNSARFEVQRSVDGREFAKLATVAAQGNSMNPTAYATLDKAAPAAKLYYRLRQVDLDGSSSFSPVVTVAGSGEIAKVELYPNPAHSRISFIAEAATPYRVLNQLGQSLLHGTTEAGTASIGLEALPTGLYFLELQTAAGRTLQKFEKTTD
ncbi:T9SS type A sorting domain-containing protein [Hymenobacter siberiensis]|uniref:T9SS type A sorting domain-containing protein n=1 Tax=Hymenobacter siberiensis TaxID=2848396 RepID=UPI001C1DEA9E|nr:T9SS type A sorting domain-containing protein [Hymenobacter siberiensis]MBU6122449.1 T9SS type A sorting domain-containing protein [Hymenobacter siberiensis]